MGSELKKTSSEETMVTATDIADVAHLSTNETFTGTKTFNNSVWVGDGSLTNIVVTNTNIQKVTGGSFTNYYFPSVGGTFALASQLTYTLSTPEQTTSDTTVTLTLNDRSINQVTLASTVTSVVMSFPTKVTGVARDLFVRLTITGSSAPDITFQEQNGDPIEFDVDDEAWADIQPGVNILMFTETNQTV